MGKNGLQREMDGFFKETENEQFNIRRNRRGMGRGKKKDLPKSMCLLSALYDPVNYLTLDVQTGPTDGNEQDLLVKHLPKVERGDILLLDRGYPSAALFSGLQSKRIHLQACQDSAGERRSRNIGHVLIRYRKVQQRKDGHSC
jgi:hypothetical protein